MLATPSRERRLCPLGTPRRALGYFRVEVLFSAHSIAVVMMPT